MPFTVMAILGKSTDVMRIGTRCLLDSLPDYASGMLQVDGQTRSGHNVKRTLRVQEFNRFEAVRYSTHDRLRVIHVNMTRANAAEIARTLSVMRAAFPSQAPAANFDADWLRRPSRIRPGL